MLDHVSLGVSDLERSRRFYDAILRPLGVVRTADFGRSPIGGAGSDYGMMLGQLGGVEFTITAETAVAPARGAHICLRAFSREAVRAFHAAALDSGGRSDGAPARARSTIRITMPLSSSIPTAIGSKRHAIFLSARRPEKNRTAKG
jgi:catechol 2,3-dioxygenase-like lactoylglutathione lyase family enzyme